MLERLRLKAKTYGTDPANPDDGNEKINVEAVVAMYKVGRFLHYSLLFRPLDVEFQQRLTMIQ